MAFGRFGIALFTLCTVVKNDKLGIIALLHNQACPYRMQTPPDVYHPPKTPNDATTRGPGAAAVAAKRLFAFVYFTHSLDSPTTPS
jgi:hypothetical protein